MIQIVASTRKEMESGEMSAWTDFSSSLEVNPAASSVLDPILAPFGLNTGSWFMRLSNTFKLMGHCPWAVIAFDREYPIGAYFCKVRGDRQSLNFSTYTGGKDLGVASMPPLSYIVAWDKPALQSAAEKAPQLLGSAWSTLVDQPVSRRWLSISDPLSNSWVKAHRDKPDEPTINPVFDAT